MRRMKRWAPGPVERLTVQLRDEPCVLFDSGRLGTEPEGGGPLALRDSDAEHLRGQGC